MKKFLVLFFIIFEMLAITQKSFAEAAKTASGTSKDAELEEAK